MHTLAVLTLLTTSFSALAIPQTGDNEPTTGGGELPFPSSIAVKYFQGTPIIESQSCGTEVSSGFMETEQCNSICTLGLSFAQAPENSCVLTLYTGTASCDISAAEKIGYPIAAGNGSVCITTGVQDGCTFQSASGVWSCG